MIAGMDVDVEFVIPFALFTSCHRARSLTFWGGVYLYYAYLLEHI